MDAYYIFILKELMISKKNDFAITGLLQFSPYIMFLILYISLYYYTLHSKNIYHSQTIILSGLPLFTAFIATIYAFFTFQESLNIDKKIEIFFSGVADIHAIHSYFNIIFIAIFNYMLAKTNGVLTAVTLSLLYISVPSMMPTIFLLTSIFSIIIPSLSAVIIIFMPIGYGIAQSLQINPAFMAATIISGSLCGSHLSLYFKNMSLSKHVNFNIFFHKNLWFILTAAITSLIMLSQYEPMPLLTQTIHTYLQSTLNMHSYIMILPYFFLLLGNILKINFLTTLIIGSAIAFTSEIMLHKILFLDAITTIFHGLCKESLIINIIFFQIIIAGLTKIIECNDGFDYIIKPFQPKENKNSSNMQGSIILISIIMNLLIIIDTLCLNFITHFIKKLTEKYAITQNNISNLVHITTTTMQVILPYASIMMLTIHITHNSYFEILHYMIYPLLITILTFLSIFFSNSDKEFIYLNHRIIK